MNEEQNSLSAYDDHREEFNSLHDTILTLQSDSEIDLFLQQVRTRLSAPGSGFSLVELSIVLVILGLLVGGVLSGQSLIKAAELRTIVRDQQRYVTATQSFRGKYFALPGDMTNATAFWSTAAACPGVSTTATGGTCNGDGDGKITSAATTANPGNESFRYWQQLAYAGMIEGSYTGTVNGTTATTYTVGTGINSPAARVGNANWQMRWGGTIPNGTYDPLYFPGSFGNALIFSKAAQTDWPVTCSLKPEEAWNVDSKIDDGSPATGIATSMPVKGGSSVCGGVCDDSYSGGSPANPKYMLSNSQPSCDLIFKSGF